MFLLQTADSLSLRFVFKEHSCRNNNRMNQTKKCQNDDEMTWARNMRMIHQYCLTRQQTTEKKMSFRSHDLGGSKAPEQLLNGPCGQTVFLSSVSEVKSESKHEKTVKNHKLWEPKVTSSNVLFCPTDSVNCESSIFKKQKSRQFCFKNYFSHSSIFNIVAISFSVILIFAVLMKSNKQTTHF